MKTDFSTWEEIKRPDKTYGMSYPYVSYNLEGEEVLFKFPFSPLLGKRNGFHCTIGDVSTYIKTEFSINIYKGDTFHIFQRDFSSVKDAYEFFLENTN